MFSAMTFLLGLSVLADLPNQFDANAVSAGGVFAGVVTCVDSTEKQFPGQFSDRVKLRYCACLFDLYLNGEPLPMTAADFTPAFQKKAKTCLDYAQRDGDKTVPTDSPFRGKCATSSNPNNPNRTIVSGRCNAEQIYSMVAGCIAAAQKPAEKPGYSTILCVCIVDAIIAKKYSEKVEDQCGRYADSNTEGPEGKRQDTESPTDAGTRRGTE